MKFFSLATQELQVHCVTKLSYNLPPFTRFGHSFKHSIIIKEKKNRTNGPEKGYRF